MSRLTSRNNLTLRHNPALAQDGRGSITGRKPSRNVSHDPVENEQIRAEIADYIATMSVELATMARAANFDVLAYFLDMARIEAKVRSDEFNGANA
jgi:hypothetical protein